MNLIIIRFNSNKFELIRIDSNIQMNVGLWLERDCEGRMFDMYWNSNYSMNIQKIIEYSFKKIEYSF